MLSSPNCTPFHQSHLRSARGTAGGPLGQQTGAGLSTGTPALAPEPDTQAPGPGADPPPAVPSRRPSGARLVRALDALAPGPHGQGRPRPCSRPSGSPARSGAGHTAPRPTGTDHAPQAVPSCRLGGPADQRAGGRGRPDPGQTTPPSAGLGPSGPAPPPWGRAYAAARTGVGGTEEAGAGSCPSALG